MIPLLRVHQISESGSKSNGDCTLLQYSDHFRQTNILIDCGIRRDVAFRYLQEFGVKKINVVIVSHIDLDHIGGLKDVLSNIDVEELWVMNINPLKRFVERSIGFEREKLHFMRCITLTHECLMTAGKRNVRCVSVYEGHNKKMGPLFIEVLSPPFAFEQFLKDHKNVERILRTPKGETYRRFLEEGHLEEDVSTEILPEHKEQMTSKQIMNLRERLEFASEYPEELLEASLSLASRGLLNNISIVARISCLAPSCPTPVFEPLTMLFPGDLEDWAYLFQKYYNYLNTAILKIPHHGSYEVKIKGRSLYEFLRPRMALVFPYPKHGLPSQKAIALIARNGLISCTSTKSVIGTQSADQCCHIANTCSSHDTIVYEFTPNGLVVKTGHSICTGTFRP